MDQSKLFTIALEEALEMLAQPKKSRHTPKNYCVLLEPNRKAKFPVELYEGRYGPYVTDGKVNASLPKTVSVDEINLDAALNLLAEAAEKKKTRKKPTTKRKTAAKKENGYKKKTTASRRKAPDATQHKKCVDHSRKR